MSPEFDPALVALILGRSEPRPPDRGHLDDDTLALLALGGLGARERAEVDAHIALCPPCRRLVALALLDEAGSTEILPIVRKIAARRPIRLALGVAASLLVAAGLALALWGDPASRALARAEADNRAGRHAEALRGLRPILEAGPESARPEARRVALAGYRSLMARALGDREFDRVKGLAAEAEGLDLRSPALANLRSRAILRDPEPLALAHAGRLDEFGVALGPSFGKGLGDPVAPGAGVADREALAVLDRALAGGEIDREAVLNRAHLLLRDRPDEALAAFRGWRAGHPDDRDAALGEALALYLAGDSKGSEAIFGGLARARPGDLDLRINHALALEAAGRAPDAAAEWRAALELCREPRLSEAIGKRLRSIDMSTPLR